MHVQRGDSQQNTGLAGVTDDSKSNGLSDSRANSCTSSGRYNSSGHTEAADVSELFGAGQSDGARSLACHGGFGEHLADPNIEEGMSDGSPVEEYEFVEFPDGTSDLRKKHILCHQDEEYEFVEFPDGMSDLREKHMLRHQDVDSNVNAANNTQGSHQTSPTGSDGVFPRHPSADTLPPGSPVPQQLAAEMIRLPPKNDVFVKRKNIRELISRPHHGGIDGLLICSLMVNIHENSIKQRWDYLLGVHEHLSEGIMDRGILFEIYVNDKHESDVKLNFERVVIKCDLVYALVRNKFISWQNALQEFGKIANLSILPNPILRDGYNDGSDIVKVWKLCGELLSIVNNWVGGVTFIQQLLNPNLYNVTRMLVAARPYLRESDIAPYLT